MADTEDLVLSHGEAEHELITSALEIEEIDKNLYRSKSLWIPSDGRGVFGGYVEAAGNFALYCNGIDCRHATSPYEFAGRIRPH